MNRQHASDLTPEIQRAVLGSFRWGASPEAAAMAAGVLRETIQSWMSRGALEPKGEFGGFFESCGRALLEDVVDDPPSLQLARVAIREWRAMVVHLMSELQGRKRRAG